MSEDEEEASGIEVCVYARVCGGMLNIGASPMWVFAHITHTRLVGSSFQADLFPRIESQ